MNNYLKLSFPSDKFLKVSVDYLQTVRNKTIMTYLPITKIVHMDALLYLMNVLKMTLDQCILFSTGPNFILNIHKDTGHRISQGESLSPWAINFAINSSNHKMKWYKEIEGSSAKRLTNPMGSDYYHIDPDKVYEIEEAVIDCPTLVRTDIPHNVINYDVNNFRYCISIRNHRNTMSWEEAYQKFKDVV
jgi:hypothetical protein